MRRLLWFASCGLLVVAEFGIVYGQEKEPRPEVTLSDREIARLDIFEERSLSLADAAFGKQEYAAAREMYGAFAEKHADSPAAPYATLRKARCAELIGKPSEAVVDYEAVVHRFPKISKYAAPALFHLGECQAAAEASDAAIETWAKFTTNANYRQTPLAAEATQRMVKLIGKEDDPAKVIDHYERLGIDWRGSEDEVAQKAIQAIIQQHVRTAPDEAKLWDFYRKIEKVAGEDPERTVQYWTWVGQAVHDNGNFTYYQREDREKYFEHWLGVLKGKFADSDDYQIALAKIQYSADRDRSKLAERLDAQFAKGQKDWQRVLKWMRAFKGNWTKTQEYGAMLTFEMAGVNGIAKAMDVLCNEQSESYLAKRVFNKFVEDAPFDKLSNDEIQQLISVALDILQDSTAARNLAGKLHFDKMDEATRLALARKYLQIDTVIARKIYDQLENQEAGKLELFEHCIKSGDTFEAILLADELAKIEKHAERFTRQKAKMLQTAKRYTEAITAYRECGTEATYMWRIVECYLALDQLDKAIEQLRAIEVGHEDEAAKAVYRIAELYGEAEEKAKRIATLREIVEKYPTSKEADDAEQELGEIGLPPDLPTTPSLDF
jgi:TolA-binding protein